MQKKQSGFYRRGAEAELHEINIEGEDALSKRRTPKSYRNSELDESIRTKRTRAEVKLLSQAAAVVNVPRIIKADEKKSEIIMEFIFGNVLKEVIGKRPELCVEAGKRIRAIHDVGIIHGDLTTSNILVAKENAATKERIAKKGELFFIDFGLGYFSKKLEDKATDLVVFKKTFNATHSSLKNGWGLVMKGYDADKEMLARMEAIEKRARYH
ncbi:KEOPS complex subunit Bud32 [uncultured archaeon]|nr:KEOPS complex subunit Bud32 [uncultured archaeon]